MDPGPSGGGGDVAALPQVPEYECRVLWEIARRSSESHAHSYTTPARLLLPKLVRIVQPRLSVDQERPTRRVELLSTLFPIFYGGHTFERALG